MTMKRTVFTDLALASQKNKFAWLSVDADNPSNAPFFTRFPYDVLPLFWVIDPSGERVLLRWDKPATTPVLLTLLEGASRAASSEARGERALAALWVDVYEEAAKKATSADERIAFDGPRLEAYFVLGEPTRAIGMLEESERDFPRYFAPPLGLARVWLALGRLDEARAAVRRAMDRVGRGWRSLTVFEVAADIARARMDAGDERAALNEGLSRVEGDSLSSANRKHRERLRERLERLENRRR